jgi:hypothetical protein
MFLSAAQVLCLAELFSQSTARLIKSLLATMGHKRNSGASRKSDDSSSSVSSADCNHMNDLCVSHKRWTNLANHAKRNADELEKRIASVQEKIIRKRERKRERKRLRLKGIAEKKGNDGEDEDEDDDGGIDGLPDKEKGGDDKDEGDDKNGPPPPPASGPSGLLAICAA